MKDNLKMIYIMAMDVLFIQMETIILEIGQMARDLAMENWWINQVVFMRGNGRIVSSLENNETKKSVKSIKILFKSNKLNIIILI